MLLWAVAGVLVMSACRTTTAATPPEFGDAFWKRWGDGQAELAGYDLVTPRYGELRRGSAVTIFVTETFSSRQRVKADPGRNPKSDEYPVMKLNLVQDFTTGIYDYNLMTSAFVALSPVHGRPAGAPTKVAFSAQEWCGHAYAQVLFDAQGARYTSHSYFDGEADQSRVLEAPAEALSEDALLLWARGFAGPRLARGETATRPLLRSLRASRLLHQSEDLQQVVLTYQSLPRMVTVPAGEFECDEYTARVQGGRTWTFLVERVAPHRIVRWECSDGEHASLITSDRMRYWEMNRNGLEKELTRLGLSPRGERMP
jgi:hypothetical protein